MTFMTYTMNSEVFYIVPGTKMYMTYLKKNKVLEVTVHHHTPGVSDYWAVYCNRCDKNWRFTTTDQSEDQIVCPSCGGK